MGSVWIRMHVRLLSYWSNCAKRLSPIAYCNTTLDFRCLSVFGNCQTLFFVLLAVPLCQCYLCHYTFRDEVTCPLVGHAWVVGLAGVITGCTVHSTASFACLACGYTCGNHLESTLTCSCACFGQPFERLSCLPHMTDEQTCPRVMFAKQDLIAGFV